jgi:ribonuclease HI
MAMRCLPSQIYGRQITVFTSNQAALLISQPQQQSGQKSIHQVYKALQALRDRANNVRSVWVPSEGNFELITRAKTAARRAMEEGYTPRNLP